MAASQAGRMDEAIHGATRATELGEPELAKVSAAYIALWTGETDKAVRGFRALVDDVSPEPPWWEDFRLAEAELGLAQALKLQSDPAADDVLARAIQRFQTHAERPNLAEARRRLAFARKIQAANAP